MVWTGSFVVARVPSALLVRREGPCRFLVLLPQAVANDFTDWLQGGVGNGVVGRCAFGPAPNNARTKEDSEVLADIRLGRIDTGDEFAHVQLIRLQEDAENRQARGIAQHPKPFGDMIEKLDGYKFRHSTTV